MVGLSRVPQIDALPLILVVFSKQRSVEITMPSSTRRGTSAWWASCSVVQARGLISENICGLVDVAVAGGAADAVIAGQGGGVGPVTEVTQSRHRLVETGQGTGPLAGTSQLGSADKRREEENDFSGNVESGTMGDHVEPSR